MTNDISKKIMFICAEASGDMLASEIIDTLQSNHIHITTSLVGEACKEKGIVSIADLSSIAKMGFSEIISIIPTVFGIRKKILQTIAIEKPDMVICVDGFAFTHFVAKKIKQKYPHIKLVRYIAPKLWAWGNWRAKKLKNFYHLILCCLPFEPKFFKHYDIATKFVGHSVVERFNPITQQEKEIIKKKYHLVDDKKIILLLPGSRHSEISQLLPIFIETAEKLGTQYQYVVPMAQNKHHYFKNLSHDFILIDNTHDKFSLFQIADCALAASGTVSLELMLGQTPTVVAYKTSWLTWWLAQYLVKVKYISLINIILDKPILPEFLQDECCSDALTQAIDSLINSPQAIDFQKKNYEICLEKLKAPDGKLVSQIVVDNIVKIL